jgi:hypothetical protein
MEKLKLLTLPGLELRSLGRPARSQSLYQLRSRGLCIDEKSKESKAVNVFRISENSPGLYFLSHSVTLCLPVDRLMTLLVSRLYRRDVI